MAIELIKENIEYEQFLGENTADTVVKEEYIIPDTEPDVLRILTVDAKPVILSKEVMQDKVYMEGQVDFDVLYVGKVDENLQICGVTYSAKFTNYVEVEGAEHKMNCSGRCDVEHMSWSIVNERKIEIEGIIKLKSEVYKNNSLDIVKDVQGLKDVQFLRNLASMDRTVGEFSDNLIAKSHIQIPSDNPEIASVLKCDANIHKKQVKLLDDKVQAQAFVKIDVLYKGKDNGEINHLSDDVLVSQEFEASGVTSTMDYYGDFAVDTSKFSVKEDDLGESRILDVETVIKVNLKVQSKMDVDVIEDAYSPELNLKIDKKDYELNMVYGKASAETIVKENLEPVKSDRSPVQVVFTDGKVSITDKKMVEDKVMIDGIVKVSAIYRSSDKDNEIDIIEDELPFSSSIDIPGCKIDMASTVSGCLESMDSSIEANTIAIKAIVSLKARVNYNLHKDFLVNIESVEGDKPEKKASVTIYTVQSGDTLWKIAKMYYTTTDDIVRLNNLENPDYILPGTKLIIPGRAVL